MFLKRLSSDPIKEGGFRYRHVIVKGNDDTGECHGRQKDGKLMVGSNDDSSPPFVVRSADRRKTSRAYLEVLMWESGHQALHFTGMARDSSSSLPPHRIHLVGSWLIDKILRLLSVLSPNGKLSREPSTNDTSSNRLLLTKPLF